MTKTRFEQWAIVELYGHDKIIGKASEGSIGGCSFIRVDVPQVEENQAYTKFFGNNAIYSMTPVDEETAIGAIKMYRKTPIDIYSAKQMVLQYNQEQECNDVKANIDLPY